jgi:hypothetical protein
MVSENGRDFAIAEKTSGLHFIGESAESGRKLFLQLSLFLDSEDLLFTSIRSILHLVNKSNPLADYLKVL